MLQNLLAASLLLLFFTFASGCAAGNDRIEKPRESVNNYNATDLSLPEDARPGMVFAANSDTLWFVGGGADGSAGDMLFRTRLDGSGG